MAARKSLIDADDGDASPSACGRIEDDAEEVVGKDGEMLGDILGEWVYVNPLPSCWAETDGIAAREATGGVSGSSQSSAQESGVSGTLALLRSAKGRLSRFGVVAPFVLTGRANSKSSSQFSAGEERLALEPEAAIVAVMVDI